MDDETRKLLAAMIGQGNADQLIPLSRSQRKRELEATYQRDVKTVALLCLVALTFVYWRRGLVAWGLSNGWSWLIAPIGSLILLAICLGCLGVVVEYSRKSLRRHRFDRDVGCLGAGIAVLIWTMALAFYGWVIAQGSN
jgi:hypothetical protein